MIKHYYKRYKEIHLAMLILGVLLAITGFTINQEITSNILIMIGSALTGVSIAGLMLVKLNPSHVKQEELEAKDERNIQITGKAATFAWYTGLLLCLALTIYLQATEEGAVPTLVSAIILIQIASFFAARLYFGKKM